MYSRWFQSSPFLDLTVLGSVLFVAVFFAVVAWLFVEKKPTFDRAAHLVFHPEHDGQDGRGVR